MEKLGRYSLLHLWHWTISWSLPLIVSRTFSLSLYLCLSLLFPGTGCCYMVQVIQKLMISGLSLPKNWDFRSMPPQLIEHAISNIRRRNCFADWKWRRKAMDTWWLSITNSKQYSEKGPLSWCMSLILASRMQKGIKVPGQPSLQSELQSS